MKTELSNFAARLRERISVATEVRRLPAIDGAGTDNEPPHVGCYFEDFKELAIELFSLQFKYNQPYQKICTVRRLIPAVIEHWTQIPAMPTSAFKELELSSIPVEDRRQVFHSSGTTEQKPSRHFHHGESLEVYEASLWGWFARHFDAGGQWLFLTPTRAAAPHSSLVHMFETVRRKLDLPAAVFTGKVAGDGSWILDFPAIVRQLETAVGSAQPVTLLGTAFSFVHLLDYLAGVNLRFQLPAGSRVMETGGYKNRSRTLPKAHLHQLISDRLGVPTVQIICEYGMSELSSQAYATPSASLEVLHSSFFIPHFRFPPWARVQIISPETDREVAVGQAGMIRVTDLANVWSVAAIQTEDLGIRREDGFELIGRAEKAEPRGCSLMAMENPA